MQTAPSLPCHLPVWALTPPDYRYAFDAAMTVLAHRELLTVRCDVPQLAEEVRQRVRFERRDEESRVDAALWVEPLQDRWKSDLSEFHRLLPAGSPLVIVASRPLARLLPVHRTWTGNPLGLRPGGLSVLRRHLLRSDFVIEQQYAIHSFASIRLNAVSRLADLLGHPDLGDRLHYAARLRYCTLDRAGSLSTVALLFTRRVSA